MKHASPSAIARLAPLLKKLKAITPLREKKPGVYYVKSKAFLHFHEDGDAIYADVRLHPPDFDRLPATTSAEQKALINKIRQAVE